MPLILQGATSGSTTIQATDAVTQTITLPNATGTVLTTASNSNFPTGSVLQVVSSSYATNSTFNSATAIDTGITVSITPSNTANKILIIANVNGVATNGVGAQSVKFTITDGSNTVIAIICDTYATPYNVSTSPWVNFFGQYLHSPATTSSTTYKIRIQGGAIQINDLNGSPNVSSAITVLEVKG